MRRLSLAIAATFTAEPVREFLEFWGTQIGASCEIEFGAYNQVFQALLDPQGTFLSQPEASAIALVRPEDWLRDADADGADWDAKLTTTAAEFLRCAKDFSETKVLLVVVCPASPERQREVQQVEGTIIHGLQAMPQVATITPQELMESCSAAAIHDKHADQLGHIPYTREFFAGLGTAIVRKLAARDHHRYKVVAVDCDNTLWGGVCAEAGPNGVELSEEYLFVQRFLVRQVEKGMLLCLCSKNREEDVFAVFEERPAMPLRREHVVTHRINWDTKSSNLASLAEELNLGVDSFIFVDDNPVEIAEVSASLPQVLAVELPAAIQDIPRFLQNLWAFDRYSVTSEDRRRTSMYAEERERQTVRKQTGGLREFLERLNLEVMIAPVQAEDIERVAQLTQRTNQFNASTIRRNASEVRSLLDSKQLACVTISVRDRFGDYGLVGAMMYRIGGTLEVDTFLLSCRVLGRTVELRAVKYLAEVARQHGISEIRIPFVETQRNQPMHDFLQSLPAKQAEAGGDGTVVFVFDRETLASLPDLPEREEVAEIAVESSEERPAATQSIDFVEIARTLATPADVMRAIALAKRTEVTANAEPQKRFESPVEEQIAAVWSEVLGRGSIGSEDDFFAIGGDSLLGTQVISRLRQIFDVPLPLRALFEAPTVAGLAVAVLHALADQGQEDEVDGILSGVEDSVQR